MKTQHQIELENASLWAETLKAKKGKRNFKLTIGMASFNNPEQVWWTVQALKMYQDISNCEILVVDNQGNDKVRDNCEKLGARYELFNRVKGTGPPRNAVFDFATGDFVLCIDSHVLLGPAAISKLKAWLSENWEDARNLIQGPIVMKNPERAFTHYNNEWRKQMWGTWAPEGGLAVEDLPREPFEIEMMGCGLFGCRKDSWLRFHAKAYGFGGVEGVIHAKYRAHGRRVLCLPFLLWVHQFGAPRAGYRLHVKDRIRNFLLGFQEIGMDPAPIYQHFGAMVVKVIEHETFGKAI